MSTCSPCDAMVSDDTVHCGNCGAAQPKVTSQWSPNSLNESKSDDTSGRLEKAIRRAELLSYAAAGLAVAMLVVIIGIAFLGR